MAYQTDAVKNAQKIFYYLLEHHELREENAPALYKAYIEQNEVQELVKSQADIADCSIAAYSGVIYLIPNEDNYFLGYSKGQMKKSFVVVVPPIRIIIWCSLLSWYYFWNFMMGRAVALKREILSY